MKIEDSQDKNIVLKMNFGITTKLLKKTVFEELPEVALVYNF
jgi:hypothetical protein